MFLLVTRFGTDFVFSRWRNLRTRSRFPQSRISHQWRLRLRVASSKIQPQSSPPHCLSRLRSPLVSSSAAETLTSQSIFSRAGRVELHVHSNPEDVAFICRAVEASWSSSFKTEISCFEAASPFTSLLNTGYKASRSRSANRNTLAASLGCIKASLNKVRV